MEVDRKQTKRPSRERLDAYELPQILPRLAQESAPRRFVLGRRVRRRRRQPLLEREGQRVDRRDRLVEPQRQARHVDERHRLQPIHVAPDRAPQRNELRPVETLQLGIGDLQRGKRAGHVAGKLQLLAREQQDLLDLGQRPLVARRRKLAIERLERGLLGLRLAETVFEQGDLGLRVAQAVLRRLHGLLRQLAGRLHLREVLRDVEAQLVIAVARIDPGRSDRDRQHRGKYDSQPPPPLRRLPRRGRRDRRWRASFVLGIRHDGGMQAGNTCAVRPRIESIVAGSRMRLRPATAKERGVTASATDSVQCPSVARGEALRNTPPACT